MASEQFVSNASELFSAAPKRRYRITEPLPVSGLRLRLRSLTERELSEFQMAVVQTTGHGIRKARLEDANRRFIALCVVDAEGNRMLTEAHAARLAEWDAADTAALYNECAAHVGIKRDDIEDLVKNSEASPAASSPTG